MSRPSGDGADVEEFLSRAKVAQLFNVAPSTVTRWADEGKLVCVRTLGGHRRYQKESIVALVHKQPKEASVETLTIEIPKMYGDHHTNAVHQVLAKAPGIHNVWASASARQVQIIFNRAEVRPEEIIARLAEAGYPPRNGEATQAALPHHKDPAWDKLGLRMTQTYVAHA